MEQKMQHTSIPEFGFLRLKQVLEIFPVSKSTWYDGIKAGLYPKPVNLSPSTVAWRVEDIRRLVEEAGR
jgi:prophage regulatory protein